MDQEAYNSLPTALLLGLIFVAWAISFSALWIGIVWFMSRFGGWARLARAYPAGIRPDGRALSGASAMVGWASYKRSLTIVPTAEGLYLEVGRIFRIGHPPIFLPWNAIHDAMAATMIFKQYVAFDIGSPKLGRMRLPAEAFLGSPITVAR